jgi:hypothetical protein
MSKMRVSYRASEPNVTTVTMQLSSGTRTRARMPFKPRDASDSVNLATLADSIFIFWKSRVIFDFILWKRSLDDIVESPFLTDRDSKLSATGKQMPSPLSFTYTKAP